MKDSACKGQSLSDVSFKTLTEEWMSKFFLGLFLLILIPLSSLAATVDKYATEKNNQLASSALSQSATGDGRAAQKLFEERLESLQSLNAPLWQIRNALYDVLDVCRLYWYLDCFPKHSSLIHTLDPHKIIEEEGFYERIISNGFSESIAKKLTSEKVFNASSNTAWRVLWFLTESDRVAAKDFVVRNYDEIEFETNIDPLDYVERHIQFSATLFTVGEIKKSRKERRKAVSAFLSLGSYHGHEVRAARILINLLEIYQETEGPIAALALYDLSYNFLVKTLSFSKPDAFELARLGASLNFHVGYAEQTEFFSRIGLEILSELNIANNVKLNQQHLLTLYLALTCNKVKQPGCGDTELSNSPAYKMLSTFSGDRPIEDSIELEFLVAQAFILAMQKKTLPENLIKMLQHKVDFKKTWNVSTTTDRSYESYRLAALAYSYNQSNPSLASGYMRSALKKIIENYNYWFNEYGVTYPIPKFDDKLILYSGGFIIGIQDKKELVSAKNSITDEPWQALNLISRDVRHSESDTLARMASTSNKSDRRVVHDYARLIEQLRVFERTRLTENLSNTLGKIPVLGSVEQSAIRTKFVNLDRSVGLLSQGALSGPKLNVTPTIKDLQNVLQDDEAFILPRVEGKESVLFCVRRESSYATAALIDPVKFSLNKRLLNLSLTALHPPSELLDRQFPVAAAQGLYDVLIKPIEKKCLQGVDTIIWAPQLDLSQIPMAALLAGDVDKNKKGLSFSTAPWLGRNYNFSYVLSASSFIASRQINNKSDGPLLTLAIGNPKLRDAKGSRVQHLVTREISPENSKILQLSELPETALELSSIKAISKGNAHVLDGPLATEGNWRMEPVGHYKYLHFATHGLLRNDLPGLTEAALVMTPSNKNYALDDGLLHASEIADLSLSADLAILSACNTANYDTNVFANEVRGLAAAFSIAGVPAVMASLWPVDSQSSNRLVTRVYKELIGNNSSPSEALSTAQNSFTDEDTIYSHPRFWAPFILLGDGRSEADDKDVLSASLSSYYHAEDFQEIYTLQRHQQGGYLYQGSSRPLNGIQGSYVQYVKDGSTVWAYKNYSIGAFSASAQTKNKYYYGGYSIGEKTKRSKANVVALDNNGQEIWKSVLDTKGDYFSSVSKIISLTGDTLLVAAQSQKRLESGVTENFLELIKINSAGDVINSIEVSLGELRWNKFFTRNYVGMKKTESGVVVSFSAPYSLLLEPIKYRDEYDQLKFCASRQKTILTLVDEKKLTTLRNRVLEGFNIRDLIPGENGFLVSGSYKSHCGLTPKAVILSVDDDFHHKPIYHDISPYQSSVISIEKNDDELYFITQSGLENTSNIDNSDILDTESLQLSPYMRARSSIHTMLLDGGSSHAEFPIYSGADIFLKDFILEGKTVKAVGLVGNRGLVIEYDARSSIDK